MKEYVIKQISNRYACDLAVQYSFNKRRPNAVLSFGIVRRKDGIVVGSVVYGNGVSPTVSMICGEDEFYNVYELNSIWVRDIPKSEKFLEKLITNTINRLDKEIIIAYCDPKQTQLIEIYNELFIYLGMTEQRVDRGYIGEEKNTLFGKVMMKPNKHNMSAWYDKENTIEVIRKQKHRYVYFNTKDEERKKELYYNLTYSEKPKPIP